MRPTLMRQTPVSSTSSTDRTTRGPRARLQAACASALVTLSVVTLVAVTARTATSQDVPKSATPQSQTAAPASPAAPAGQAITVADTPEAAGLPPLPFIKTPADEPKALSEVYTFVGAHPEVAQYMPCFCACGRSKIHKSIDDCFIKSRGTTPQEVVWSAHGGECMICIAVAAEARRLYLQGQSVSAIRDEIERTLAPKFKYHTDTPMPPTAHLHVH